MSSAERPLPASGRPFASVLLLASLLFVAAPAASASPGWAADDSVPVKSIESHGGCHLPAKGRIRGLVVFMQTRNDRVYSETWPLDQLPTWAGSYIAEVRDFFSGVSGGELTVDLDLYPTPVTTDRTEWDYLNLNQTFGNVTREIIARIDTVVDFSLYDNWNAENHPYLVEPGGERQVDLVIFIWRSIEVKRFMPYSGVSDLGFGGQIFVDGMLRYVYGGTSMSNDAGASGISISDHPGTTTVIGGETAFRITAHELWHKLQGEGHVTQIFGGLGLNSATAGGIAPCSFERHLLGYITFRELPPATDTVVVLHDYLSTGEAALLPIPEAPRWYYAFEYRNRSTRYDRAPGTGVYIYRIYDSWGRNQKQVHAISSDGAYQWRLDTALGKPVKDYPDPLRGQDIYQTIPINGTNYTADGFEGDSAAAFSPWRPTFSSYGNPSADFLFAGDTIVTDIYVRVLAMNGDSAVLLIGHQPPAILGVAPGRDGAVALGAAYPNPARSGRDARIAVPFAAPEGLDARLDVFDALGRRVASIDREASAAARPFTVGLAGLPRGLYLTRLRCAGAVRTGRFIIE